METNCYIYAYLDPRKKGSYLYLDYTFEYEPFYIGVSNTSSKNNRLKLHTSWVKHNKDLTNNTFKFNVINKILNIGLEPIVIILEENLDRISAYQKERLLIDTIGTRYNVLGSLTNIAKGGDGGDTFTNNPRKEEIREKHRQNAIGSNNNMYGLPLEQRPSHISKMSGNHWNKGRIADQELRNKFSELRKGHKNITAKVTLLLDDNYEIIQEFLCAKYAAEYFNIRYKALTANPIKTINV